eukprot:1763989-Pleurochrysis_carterae.AAC.3
MSPDDSLVIWSSVCMAPAAQLKPSSPTAAAAAAAASSPPAALAGLKRAMRASAYLILGTVGISIVRRLAC